MGLIFVLLLGEIDLSAGFTSGVCAPCMAIAARRHGLPWYVAILAAVVTGTVIGLVLGIAGRQGRHPVLCGHARRVPGLPGRRAAAHQGRQHHPDPRPGHPGHRNKNMPPLAGLGACYAVAVGGYALVQFSRMRGRAAPRPDHRPARAWCCCASASLAVGAGIAVVRAEPGAQPQRADRLAQGRADRGADHRGPAGGADVRAQAHRRTACTSTPSAATARRPGGPASTSTGSGSRPS